MTATTMAGLLLLMTCSPGGWQRKVGASGNHRPQIAPEPNPAVRLAARSGRDVHGPGRGVRYTGYPEIERCRRPSPVARGLLAPRRGTARTSPLTVVGTTRVDAPQPDSRRCGAGPRHQHGDGARAAPDRLT
jgi:hypothetical protein